MKKTKKGLSLIALLTIFIVIFITVVINTGCNCRGYDLVDTNYHFDRAIIKTPDGETFEISVKMWADSEGEQLTITSTDGTRYLVHSANVIMIEDNN